MEITPLVSVSCITYNHAPYIRQCLDGFIMQKTNFCFEVLIHDDASTDGTTEIIKEYEAKYPDIIRPLYEEENQWIKGRRGSIIFNYPRAKGKYIALCEGDDYWTDPLKLQKQVDFLEENPDYAICFHPVKKRDEQKNIIVDNYYRGGAAETTDIYDLAKGNYIATLSVMFRKNQQVLDIFETNTFSMGDYPLHMLNAQYGKIKKLPDVMAVYRMHSRGIWSSKSDEYKNTVGFRLSEQMIPLFEDKKVVRSLKRGYGRNAYFLYECNKKNNDISAVEKYFLIACKNHPLVVCKNILKLRVSCGEIWKMIKLYMSKVK
jgi:glycosyltransferase involved in cell wall biosynthesis